MAPKRQPRPAFRIAFLGLLLALALALSFMESLLPPLVVLPVGVKPGLSNIVTMYCLFFLGAKDAFTIATLKSFFVFLIRGPTGALMSFSGGLFSVFMMLMIQKGIPALSNSVVSVAGALGHNIGQLLMASVLLQSAYTFYYLPVMILSGIGMGLLTGLLLRLVMPYLQRADGVFK